MDINEKKTSYTPSQKRAIQKYRRAHPQKAKENSKTCWSRWYANEENKKAHNKRCLERYYRKKEEKRKEAIAIQETLGKSPF